MSNKTPSLQTIIIAHAPLASALRAVAVHVLGEASVQASGVVFLDVAADAPPERTSATILAHCHKAAQALFLSDLPHATPHNCAVAAAHQFLQAQGQEAAVISHCTAAMVLRAVSNGVASAPLDLARLTAKLQLA